MSTKKNIHTIKKDSCIPLIVDIVVDAGEASLNWPDDSDDSFIS
jgi:hypothetical protein